MSYCGYIYFITVFNPRVTYDSHYCFCILEKTRYGKYREKNYGRERKDDGEEENVYLPFSTSKPSRFGDSSFCTHGTKLIKTRC